MRRLLAAATLACGLGLAPSAWAAIGVTANAGVQGYTGSLANALLPGFAWGVNAELRNRQMLELELGYHGASSPFYGPSPDPLRARTGRMIEGGVEALAHLSLVHAHDSMVEPYLLGGIGTDWFHVTQDVAGFQDDMLGAFPVGAGINVHPRPAFPAINNSSFTLGLRGNYDILFGNQFESQGGGNAFRGLVTLGGAF